MKHVVVGLLAHVDAGKTTLAEALLYASGAIRTYGRVDHRDSYLDYEDVERERGITVVSKEARISLPDMDMSLLDAPGHVDFSTEAERTLQVLDAAVLVVAANEPIRAHTRTLWRLLRRYAIPTVVFVNKMDLADVDRDAMVHRCREGLDENCFSFEDWWQEDTQEEIATSDEEALERYLSEGTLDMDTLQRLFGRRRVFPCVMGSALRQEGIATLIDALQQLVRPHEASSDFGARVYKVSHGRQGDRLVWLKVLGGVLHAKDTLSVTTGEGTISEKVNQLRLYSGQKYDVVQEVEAGQICVVLGLDHATCGMGLGCEKNDVEPTMHPVLVFAVKAPEGDARRVHEALLELENEDPLLCVSWNEESQESNIQLMGQVQLEVIRERLRAERGLEVEFGTGSIVYKETIAQTVEGIGHFEPLRHYAEVHMELEPLPRGSGMVFGTVCSEDELDRNWQRLILTNAMERPHRGVLVGAPITDIRITLVAGRAHPKHTEGGDFRQATYRAIRQGLMQARSILLEPYYDFELMVPAQKAGRALSDLQGMAASFEVRDQTGEDVLIAGRAPVSEIGSYPIQVSSYTSGQGSLFLVAGGYDVCHNAEEVVAAMQYVPEADLAHTPDSVFCSHGAGYRVKWRDVAQFAHVVPDASHRRPWREANAGFFSASAEV